MSSHKHINHSAQLILRTGVEEVHSLRSTNSREMVLLPRLRHRYPWAGHRDWRWFASPHQLQGQIIAAGPGVWSRSEQAKAVTVTDDARSVFEGEESSKTEVPMACCSIRAESMAASKVRSCQPWLQLCRLGRLPVWSPLLTSHIACNKAVGVCTIPSI